MAEDVTERVSRYILDGSDQDLRRLLRIAERQAEDARSAFRRLGVQHGWNVIDCGCGPLGGLTVLAELVGPAGRVVGVDVSQAAVQQARAAVAALELGNVEVIAGDLHELDAVALGAPFDLAFTRAFMTHQADPVRTLRHISDLLRPGGWLVAQEPLPSPPPRSHPHLEALTGAWDLIYEVLQRAGVPAGAVEDLPRSARQAGLDVTAMSGSFLVDHDSERAFEIYAVTLAAARERGIQLGIAADKIDGLVRDLRAAKGGGHEWVSSAFYLDLALRKPAAG
jgi:SAM-dependent methyltransferase